MDWMKHILIILQYAVVCIAQLLCVWTHSINEHNVFAHNRRFTVCVLVDKRQKVRRYCCFHHTRVIKTCAFLTKFSYALLYTIQYTHSFHHLSDPPYRILNFSENTDTRIAMHVCSFILTAHRFLIWSITTTICYICSLTSPMWISKMFLKLLSITCAIFFWYSHGVVRFNCDLLLSANFSLRTQSQIQHICRLYSDFMMRISYTIHKMPLLLLYAFFKIISCDDRTIWTW